MEEERTPSYYDNIFTSSSNGQDEEEEDEGNGMNQNDVVPYVGKLFESRKCLEKFLDRYGKSVGFQWRTRSSRKNSRSGDVCGARYVCSKHGVHKPRGVRMNCPEPSARVGCEASITTSMQKNGEWKINKVILEHNHENDACSSGFLRRYRHVPPHIKYRLMTNQRSGIGVRKTYSSLLVENQGIENLGVLERDCRNYVGAERRQTLGGGDAEAAMDYFGRMQTENPDFFYLPQIDKEGRLQNIFWADARSRAAYTEFGDVVSFDTTYKKNKYDMPFAPFVGVNHHGETILFGCALLLHEDIESFSWLFRTWLTCMGGCAPRSIITDQDAAMRNAIKEVLPKTKHRWCIWHILTKVEQKLGKRRYNIELNDDLLYVVHDTYDPCEFDMEWEAFIGKYSLQENEWIRSLSENREYWAPAYLNDYFWGGMQSTQRSEAANGHFGTYFSSHSPLREFVRQYDVALKEKVGREILADARCKECTIPCVTRFGIEKVFQSCYTTKKFRKFQEQAVLCNHCVATRIPGVGNVRWYAVEEKVGIPPVSFTFIVSLDEISSDCCCSCKMFETNGIVCRHMVRVIDTNDVEMDKFSEKYILRRWRKDLARTHSRIKAPYIDPGFAPDIRKYDDLRNLFEKLSTVALVNDEAYAMAKTGLQQLGLQLEEHREAAIRRGMHYNNRPISMCLNREIGVGSGSENTINDRAGEAGSSGEANIVLDPPAVRRRGRPLKKRRKYNASSMQARRARTLRRATRNNGENTDDNHNEIESEDQDEFNRNQGRPLETLRCRTNAETRISPNGTNTLVWNEPATTQQNGSGTHVIDPHGASLRNWWQLPLNFSQHLASVEANAQGTLVAQLVRGYGNDRQSDIDRAWFGGLVTQ